MSHLASKGVNSCARDAVFLSANAVSLGGKEKLHSNVLLVGCKRVGWQGKHGNLLAGGREVSWFHLLSNCFCL